APARGRRRGGRRAASAARAGCGPGRSGRAGRTRRRTRGSGQGPEGCGVVRPRCAHGPGFARPRREAPVTERAGAPPARDVGAPPAGDAAPVGLVLLRAPPPAPRATPPGGALPRRPRLRQEALLTPAGARAG